MSAYRIPPAVDSVVKIKKYLVAASQPSLVVSPKFFRGYTCPPMCGGCCKKWTIDYFDGSTRWERFKATYPRRARKYFIQREVDGVKVWTDAQQGTTESGQPMKDRISCRWLDDKDGRCLIWNARPLSCEFELSKLYTRNPPKKAPFGLLVTQLFARGWNMRTLTGRGAACTIVPLSGDKLLKDIAMLKELVEISARFRRPTHLPKLLMYLRKNSLKIRGGAKLTKPLVFGGGR